MARSGKRGRERGYVALELLAVLAVIALLLALGFMLHRGMRLAVRVSVAESNLKQVATGLELYFRRYNSYPPQGSDLTVELAPFVDNPEVFGNPLMDEETLGQTLNALYRAPTLDELDAPGRYLAALIGEDGKTLVVLRTGPRVQRRGDLCFDPSDPSTVLAALLDPPGDDGEPTDAGHDETGKLAGSINLNPNNNDDFEFCLQKPDSTTITRDDLHADGTTYAGPAVEIIVRPKGNGAQNGLTLDGEAYRLRNGTLYVISSKDMTVRLYNSKTDGNGKAMGKWWIDIAARNATIQPSK